MAEVTALSPAEEAAFQAWVAQNRITDVDHPDSHYDYRGYWKGVGGAAHTPGAHFPDTFKQHGHPTFSQESQYSMGHPDGGMWVGNTFLAQPKMAPSHSVLQDALMVRLFREGR